MPAGSTNGPISRANIATSSALAPIVTHARHAAGRRIRNENHVNPADAATIAHVTANQVQSLTPIHKNTGR